MAAKLKLPEPDAWQALCIRNMSVEDLRQEIAEIQASQDARAARPQELRWFQAELARRA